MIDPRDIMKVDDENWEEFKQQAMKDELYYNGPKFCRLNKTSVFNKPDPEFPGYKIWVYNLQGQGLIVKKLSRVDHAVMENVEYDADGKEISRSYEPA